MKWFRRWLLKRRIKRARQLFILIDKGIKNIGMPRHARKQMWRDFARMKDNHSEILDLIEVK